MIFTNKKYLVIDCETGGIGLEYSLLTAYFGILNKKGELLDELNLKLIPDDGTFILNQEGMKINQIDIRNWDGIYYKSAKAILYKFLDKWYKESGNLKFISVGQAVDGDIQHIKKYLISEGSWFNFVENIPRDTLYLATYLRDSGALDIRSLSLRALAEFFNLDASNLHDAKFDALLTWQIYEKLRELMEVKI